MSEFAFDAFISYSHKDMKWGQWLQKKLETFNIPKDMPSDQQVSKKLRVFRDQTDLAGVELNAALRKELETSRYLIVICSPNSAKSSWCNEEVMAFHAMGRTDYIIPFIVEGEPESEDPSIECYPEGLRNIEGHHMLGANVQEIGKNKAFLKLVSIILNVRFNRLVDREKQRRRKMALTIGSISAVVAVVVIALAARNAIVSKRNHELSYDIYLAAMDAAFKYGATLEENLQAVDINYLTASAEEGNTDAMYLLSSCYDHGYGTEADPQKALYWAKKGAETGEPSLMLLLGYYYQYGIGTKEDPEEAFRWYLKAAQTEDPQSMLRAGMAYEGGIGTPMNPEEAFYWYKKAADTGLEEAMMHVALCYRDGFGVEQNKEEAFAWNKKVAELGNNTDAMYNVALMNQYGYGTEENPEEAYLWYRKGAEAGDPVCAYYVGWCTENRYGTTDAALEWYKKAEELAKASGNAKAEAAAREEIARLSQ